MVNRALFLLPIVIHLNAIAGDKAIRKFKPEIKYGVEAGLNAATLIYQSPKATGDFAILWHVGLYAYMNLNDKISLMPELDYSIKGNSIETGPNSSSVVNYLSYIELPIQLKDNIGKGYSVFGGFYFGYLTNVSSTQETTVYSNSSSVNNNSYLNNIDFGLVAGAGYQYNSGFNYGIKCNAGLTNVNKSSLNVIPMTNFVFSVYVGWTFQ